MHNLLEIRFLGVVGMGSFQLTPPLLDERLVGMLLGYSFSFFAMKR